MNERINVSSGSPWESKLGYSRLVKVGRLVFVAGTTASDDEGKVIGVGDPYAQTKYIFEKIKKSLSEVGSNFSDIVRVRMFTTDIGRWEEIGKAHADCFSDIKPAATIVQVSKLISSEMMVEIEVDAVLRE
ncbi:MAG: RidA family protein [Nitrososphaerales archaeon]